MAVAGKEFASAAPRRPRHAPDGPFLLCIGNDFRHKNRLFAIKLLAELRARGWDGSLVLAGAHVESGSSRGDEAAYLASRPELAIHVHELPAVSEAEKAWLYGNAAAIVYPTVYEGFGLIPFEAARARVPCLFAAQASLAEVLPPEAAVLVPWDGEASADRALPLLRDSDERRRHLELLASAARRMPGWDEIVERLLRVYEETALLPVASRRRARGRGARAGGAAGEMGRARGERGPGGRPGRDPAAGRAACAARGGRARSGCGGRCSGCCAWRTASAVAARG